MAREKWNILSNMFEVKTRGSFRKAFSFAQSHFNYLKGASSDPAIASVYNDFGPTWYNFKNAYTRWMVATGLYRGAVQDMNETLLSINKKLKVWEGKIHAQFYEGTEEAKSIFPHKRTPFYKGSDIARTEAVAALIITLNNYPTLSDTKADVQAFYSLLKSKVDAKHVAEGTVIARSTELEEQRQLLMAEIYGNLGRLLYVYRHNLSVIDNYFDMGVIKNKVRRKKRGEEEE